MQPLSGNQRPDLLTALMNMSYCTCHGKCIFADPLHMSHACHRFWKCYKTLHYKTITFLLTFDKVHNPLRLPRETTPERPTRAGICGAFNILTSTYASRHNGVHFFDISTSKSGPNMVSFVHFDLKMCFAPQWRPLFRHLNFQKWSAHGVFCTFWLGNVLRATTACTFWTSQLPKVVRAWCVLYILAWKMCFRQQRRALFRYLNFQKWSGHGVFCTFWLGNVLRATMACTFSTSQLPKSGSHP